MTDQKATVTWLPLRTPAPRKQTGPTIDITTRILPTEKPRVRTPKTPPPDDAA